MSLIYSDPAEALRHLGSSLRALTEERKAVLGVITLATSTGDRELLMEYAGQLANIRKLHTNMSMAIAAYHSGVKSAAVLACLMNVYLDLPAADRAPARVEIVRVIALIGSESEVASEKTVAELATAKRRAELEKSISEDNARTERAKQRLALREKAFDMAHPLWRAFHSKYDITDNDIGKLLSGMSSEDVAALTAK